MATRRSLLARCGRMSAVGALLSAAGCVDRSASDDAPGANAAPETETPDSTEAEPEPTVEEALAAERPDFAGYLDDANGFDGTVADRRGEETVTVRVGAGQQTYAFDPPAVHVDNGTTVQWEWTGEGGAHNVVAANDAFDSGLAESGPEVRFEHTFSEDGVYNYACVPHRASGMRGAVVVGSDYPTMDGSNTDADVDDIADDQSHYFSDANGYDGGPPTDRTGEDVVTVRVGAGDHGFAFDPVELHVDVGTTVRFEWTGEGGGHNVVAEDGTFDSGSAVAEPGVNYEHTFTEVGAHRYHCAPHWAHGMKGGIAVKD